MEVANDAGEVCAALEISAEAEREPERPPEDSGPTHRREALHHDCQDVLPADQTTIEEREPGRHQHDEARAEKHEAGVTGIEVQMRHACLLMGDGSPSNGSNRHRGWQQGKHWPQMLTSFFGLPR